MLQNWLAVRQLNNPRFLNRLLGRGSWDGYGYAHWGINELGMVGMFNHSGLTVIRFPHWALFLLAFAFAVTPWLYGRYSLRTLLIAVTIVADIFGLLSLYAPTRQFQFHRLMGQCNYSAFRSRPTPLSHPR